MAAIRDKLSLTRETPLSDDAWSEPLGGGGRAPFFPLKAVGDGKVLTCVCHEVHDPAQADSTFVRESGGWEGVCTIEGREATLAVTSKALASWLRANVHAGTRFQLKADGDTSGENERARTWRGRVGA